MASTQTRWASMALSNAAPVILNASLPCPALPKPQVEFERPVDAKGNIEVWLQRLVDGMQGTIKHTIKEAVRNVYVSVPTRGAVCGLRCWAKLFESIVPIA
jgi:hypothetical protein